MHKALITVEVAYALPNKQLILTVKISQESTVETAIYASGILQQFPEIDLKVNKIGIFSKLTKLNASLRDLDRVEIYRALIVDPKVVRRQRAQNANKENIARKNK
ncbi:MULTISPECIES: RnfH family protein [Methylotenera]|uniref:RnfH family protein n=1 Tax=Methylotenera TaxID=359407 RepID=UPI00036DB18E|nr:MULTISPECIES: RnfH family protein [Methylotenera]